MTKLQEVVNLNTAVMTEVIRNFRATMGGKYGKISDNQDAMTMIRAIMTDIERINENLKEASQMVDENICKNCTDKRCSHAGEPTTAERIEQRATQPTESNIGKEKDHVCF